MTSGRSSALLRIVRWKYLIPVAVAAFALVWVGGIYVDTYLQVSEGGRIPILMYHTIAADEDEESRYGLPLTGFEEQLEYLQRMKVKSVLLEDLWKAQRGDTTLPQNSVIITFDDGTTDHHSRALPLLEKYGFRGVFFALSDPMGKKGYLTEEEVRDLVRRGMSVQSHTHTHKLLDQLSSEQIRYELSKSKEILSRLTDSTVDFLCIPGGWYDERVIEIAKATGFKAMCSSDIGMNSRRDAQYVLRRLEVRGDMGMAEFVRIFSTPRIASERIKRDLKLAVHRILGSSRYRALAHVYQGRIYHLLGGGILIIALAAGVIVFVHRRQSRLRESAR